jgi:sortase (surface protein transpeptidase)
VREPPRRAVPRPTARLPWSAGWLVLLVGLAGCGGTAPTHDEAAPPPAPSIRPGTGSKAATVARRRSSAPVRIEIPAIGVSAAVIRLGLNRDGSMQVPTDFGLTGWFTGGPAPGETGPAVIAGHIDSRTGPAVFYRLRELRAGDRIEVLRADRTSVQFAVANVVQYPKQAFPTAAVFGPAPEPLLRLITCGGTFDRSRRSYRDNVVVTARLA